MADRDSTETETETDAAPMTDDHSGRQPSNQSRTAGATGRRGRPLLPKLIMAVAAVGLFLFGYQWGNQFKRGGTEPPQISGVMLRPPQPLPDFVLKDSAGGDVGRTDLLDGWALLDFAPLADARGHRSIARLVEVYNRLAAEPELRKRLRLLLVSADSSPRLARDFERLSPAIGILGAERGVIDELRNALGASEQPASDELSALFLIGPDATLVALFPTAQPAAEIAADVAALAQWPGSVESSADRLTND